MKKLLLLASCALMGAAAVSAQGTITMTTNAEAGTKVKFLPNAVSAMSPITVDYGNGVPVKYTVDPGQAAYNRWIEGTIEGKTITISGYLTELTFENAQLATVTVDGMTSLTTLDLSENEITDFELMDLTPLTNLNLSHNKIVNSPSVFAKLSLEYAGKTLKFLNLSFNENLMCLDASDLVVLEYLTVNDCPDFTSMFLCLPEESRPMLRSINAANCDLAHFYPVSLPGLTSLDLSNNSLLNGQYCDDPFVLGDYPSLTSLSVSGNPGISELDVTSCKKLEKLYAADCRISSLDLAQCPELLTLSVANNKIASLDLGNNVKLQTLSIANNPIADLDFDVLLNKDAYPRTSLQTVDISGTGISRVNLMKSPYLKSFKAARTNLQFVDFNGQQAGRMDMIDLSDCPKFTYESMAYTLRTLPQAKSSYSSDPNLLIKGSNADKADTDYITDGDMGWHPDVLGDGSASWNEIAVTLVDATDTGVNKTGTVDRLYPIMGYSMPYDLDVMHTDGGDFILAQWQPRWFQTVQSVSNTALNGVPMYVYTYPEEGKRFKSVTVNGVEIASPWFIVTEPSTIKVNFINEEQSVTLTVAPGQEMSFVVNTESPTDVISIDWGTGTRTSYTNVGTFSQPSLYISGNRIDGTAAGSKVTIYGNIRALNFEGFGDAAEYFGLWDNHIEAIDLTNCPDLLWLSLYWNPITELDLSPCPDLLVLNTSYTALKTLDLSHNPDLLALQAYSDGWGDEEEGIAMLKSLDVTNMPYLQYLQAKNNELTSIDLSHNPYLYYLDLGGNDLTSIDLSQNTLLEELNLSRNKLTTVDLSHNTELIDLSLESNSLTAVDLSHNTELQRLTVANNDLHALNTSALKKLQRLYINGNGMNADELNDLYYQLPVRVDNGTEDPSTASTWNLAVIQGTDKVENEGTRADSSIAEDRQWTPSHVGSNGGSTTAYLDIITPLHGTVEVCDEAGNVYTHGSKVEKYIPLKIIAVPEEGYEFNSYSLNGELPEVATSFDMPGIYTKLTVNFRRSNGIASTTADGVTVSSVHGTIIVATPDAANVSIYDANGRTIAATTVTDAASFAVNPGVYFVTVDGHTTTIAVK